MEKNEFAILAKSMKAVYTGANFLPDTAAMDIWYSLLKDLDYKTAALAVQDYIQSEKYPPTVADIREKSVRVNDGDGMTALEAWGYVRKALRNSIYHADEEFSNLPIECQQAIGSPDYLCETCRLSTSEVETVCQSQFIKSYGVVADRRKEDAKLSPNIRSLIDKTAAKMIEQNNNT